MESLAHRGRGERSLEPLFLAKGVFEDRRKRKKFVCKTIHFQC